MNRPAPATSYRAAMYSALSSAVALNQDIPGSSDQLQAALRDLHAHTTPLTYMADWAEQVRSFLGHTGPARSHLETIDKNTGEPADIEQNLPADVAIGARLVAALLNRNHDTTHALWQKALKERVQADVLVFVLRSMAALIDPTNTQEV